MLLADRHAKPTEIHEPVAEVLDEHDKPERAQKQREAVEHDRGGRGSDTGGRGRVVAGRWRGGS